MTKKQVDIKEAEAAAKAFVKFYESLPVEDDRTVEKVRERLEADLERARGIIEAADNG